MDYYGSSQRQYNGLEEETIKFPTRTNLAGAEKQPGILNFVSVRAKPDINIH